jgi:serine/threonine-protein phosphatase 6 regulatory ankyrin repeat subunit B
MKLSSLFLMFAFTFFAYTARGQEVIPASLIITAIKEKDCAAALKMLSRADDLNYMDNAGGTMLMHSSISGCIDVASELVKKGARVGLKTNEGFTALHMASRNGHFEIADILLKMAQRQIC